MLRSAMSLTDFLPAAATAKLLQSCPTLCDPIDSSPPGSPVPGILQARTLEWVAISFSSAQKWKLKVMSLSRVWILETPWTGAYQSPPSMVFSRQEYWSGLPLPSPALLINIYLMVDSHPYCRKQRGTKDSLDEGEREEWRCWLKVQYSKNEDHDIWSHYFMTNRLGNSDRLYFLGFWNHCRQWLQPWKTLAPWK